MAAKHLKAVENDPTVEPAKKNVKVPQNLGVMGQIKSSLKNPTALFVGILLGGLVPLAVYVLAHNEISNLIPIYTQLPALFVLGGLIFSARTVYEWTTLAFGSKPKALGFVLLIEGVMTLSHTSWLAVTALVYLIVINAVATGCRLAQAK